jgi:predicted extracellular nuclease
VFNSSNAVNVGEQVRVRGTVTEFNSSGTLLTELTNVNGFALCSTGNSVTATEVSLPVTAFSDFERYEDMLVHFSQTLTANETFTLARFGEVRLAANGRLYTPTAVTTPGSAAATQEDLNQRRSFVLDDGDNQQNIDPTIHPVGGLSASNTLRSGYTTDNLTGIFEQRFGDYRLQPLGPVPFTAANPRAAAPEPVGGNLKVASFNVLNFFNGDGLGGGFPTSRGANTQFELDRQKAKESARSRR